MIIKFLKVFLDHSNCKNVVIPKEIEEEGTLSITPQSKYVQNELIHHIQSLLPEKDAARTCVLSKSWLHAWSTIPTLRFTTFVTNGHLTKQEDIDYIKLIDRTLLRYLNDNMPIECLHLHLDIEKLPLPSPVENWFQVLASKNTLKELSLTICGKKLARNTTEADQWLTINIPNAIFSSENLNTLSLVAANNIGPYQVRMNIIPAIKCSSLCVLELVGVCISEGALNNLLSSCSLLEKIHIDHSEHLKIIKVKNLRHLRELKIRLHDHDSLELYDVPRLRLFVFSSLSRYDATRMDTLGSVSELHMFIKIVDKAFLDMIKSKFPFLEILTLSINRCMIETIDITGVSLKRLTLNLRSPNQINIQVFASKLLYFCYSGLEMHSLLFPYSTPAHIKLMLSLCNSEPKDLSYFLKMRETLDLSSNFDIEIEDNFVPLNIDLDHLRRMVPFPARNVQQLSFGKHWEELWKHSPLLDLLFSICYPCYAKAYYRSSNGKNYWCEQMVGMMEKKTCDLKDIEIKNPIDGKWDSLTNSWRSSHSLFELPRRSFINDEGDDYNSDEFKLNWWS